MVLPFLKKRAMKKIQDILQRDMMTMVGGAVAGQILGGMNDKRQDRANERNTRRQVEASKELGNFNVEKQKELWEHTGYKNQVRQMQEAGVNPALLYGKGGAGGQTAAAAAGSAGGGMAAPSSGGEVMGMTEKAIQGAMMKAQIDNLNADTEKKRAEATKTGGVDTDLANENIGIAKAEKELRGISVNLENKVFWDRVNMVVSQTIEQQEKGVIAGVNKEIAEETKEDNIKKVKAEAVNIGLQKAAIEAGVKLTEEQTRKIGSDIAQRWEELNLTKSKNDWEHHDRLKAIEDFTDNALKVAGIQAAGNIVRDVLGVVTQRGQTGMTTTRTTSGPKGVTMQKTVTKPNK